jgi:hypothetical protein
MLSLFSCILPLKFVYSFIMAVVLEALGYMESHNPLLLAKLWSSKCGY